MVEEGKALRVLFSASHDVGPFMKHFWMWRRLDMVPRVTDGRVSLEGHESRRFKLLQRLGNRISVNFQRPFQKNRTYSHQFA